MKLSQKEQNTPETNSLLLALSLLTQCVENEKEE